jgi:putative polyketide hydroxylase
MKHFPAVVIGAGPVGLSMALALARQGIKTLILEKHPSTTDHPKARGISMRTMELFRLWGNAEELLHYEQPKEARRFIWVKSLQGEEVTRIAMDYDSVLSYGPILASLTSQDKVEQSLYHTLRKQPHAAIHFLKQVVDIAQDDTGVTLRVIGRSNQQEEYIRASYVVAADGANSEIRSQLNIQMDGPNDLGHYCNVYCSMDISTWTEHRPFSILRFADPKLTSRFLASVDGKQRWIFGMRFTPNQTKEDFTDEYCLDEIRRVLNLPNLPIEIFVKKFWTLGAQIATAYRKGRIFLAGDAAHRVPPTGGLGMNTGVQDAHNLAWKLALVLKGQASDKLLDTYYEERAAVAKTIITWSRENFQRNKDITQAINAGDMQTLAEKLHDQQKNLNYTGLDLGLIYHSAAIVAENKKAISIAPDKYVPTTLPGIRAPHVWLLKAGIKTSTLDLFEKDFVLLVSTNGQAWQQAAEQLGQELKMPIKTYRIAIDGDLQDIENNWQATYEIDVDGAVLVRPDGHVAWRSKAIQPNPYLTLGNVFKKILISS